MVRFGNGINVLFRSKTGFRAMLGVWMDASVALARLGGEVRLRSRLTSVSGRIGEVGLTVKVTVWVRSFGIVDEEIIRF